MCTEFTHEVFVAMNRDAPTSRAAGTVWSRRAGRADGRREMDGGSDDERLDVIRRTADGLVGPVQCESRLGEAITVVDRPGFADDDTVGESVANQGTRKIARVNVELGDRTVLVIEVGDRCSVCRRRRLRRVGRCNVDRGDDTAVQIARCGVCTRQSGGCDACVRAASARLRH